MKILLPFFITHSEDGKAGALLRVIDIPNIEFSCRLGL